MFRQIYGKLWHRMTLQREWFRSYPGMFAAAACLLMSLLAGCSTSSVDVSYAPKDPVDQTQSAPGNLTLGHFSDRRGKDPFWVGEIVGKYHYPKTILETTEPVTKVVRDVIERTAKRRGLLNDRGGDADYQLSGEIIRLHAITSEDTEAHAVISLRLTKRCGSEEVYRQQHRLDINNASGVRQADKLADLLEELLNQVVTDALDAQPFRDRLSDPEELAALDPSAGRSYF